MATATDSRTRSLSQAGRDLFNLVPSEATSSQAQLPPTKRTTARTANSFTALQDSSEEDEGQVSNPNSPPARPVQSPRFMWARYDDAAGSPWQSSTPPPRVPRLNLDAQAPPLEEQPPQTLADGDDEDDLFYQAADVKERRVYGSASKTNTFKALNQRIYAIEKREAQRKSQQQQMQA